MKQHKTAIVLAFFLFAMMVLSSLNLYFLLENINTREDRIRQSVEKVLKEAKQGKAIEPTTIVSPNITPKEIQYIKGADGQKGLDGVSIKGDKGDKGDPGRDGQDGKDGQDAPLLEIRCNLLKNRWETRYTGNKAWKIMNDTPINCITTQVELNDALSLR